MRIHEVSGAASSRLRVLAGLVLFCAWTLGVSSDGELSVAHRAVCLDVQSPQAVAVDVSGTTVAALDGNGNLFVLDAVSCKKISSVASASSKQHGSEKAFIAFSPLGDSLVVCGCDGTVRKWSTRALDRRPEELGSVPKAECLAMGLDGSHVAIGDSDGSVVILDTSRNQPAHPQAIRVLDRAGKKPVGGPVLAVSFRSDDKAVVAVTKNDFGLHELSFDAGENVTQSSRDLSPEETAKRKLLEIAGASIARDAGIVALGILYGSTGKKRDWIRIYDGAGKGRGDRVGGSFTGVSQRLVVSPDGGLVASVGKGEDVPTTLRLFSCEGLRGDRIGELDGTAGNMPDSPSRIAMQRVGHEWTVACAGGDCVHVLRVSSPVASREVAQTITSSLDIKAMAPAQSGMRVDVPYPASTATVVHTKELKVTARVVGAKRGEEAAWSIGRVGDEGNEARQDLPSIHSSRGPVVVFAPRKLTTRVVEDCPTFTPTLQLSEGTNLVYVVADVGGKRSSTVRTVTYIPPDTSPDSYYRSSYALVIGVGDYKGLEPLRFAAGDARSVRDKLADNHGFTVKLLIDADATKKAIETAVLDLATRPPCDRVIVYFSGHGIAVPDLVTGKLVSFLVPWLPGAETIPNTPSLAWYRDHCVSSDFLYDQLRKYIPARQVLFIIDACYAAPESASPAENLGIYDQIGDLAYLSSREILAASSGDEVTMESATWKHGFLTQALVKALDGTEPLSTLDIIRDATQFMADPNEQCPHRPVLVSVGPGDGHMVFVRSTKKQ